jgi:hypothetical protein
MGKVGPVMLAVSGSEHGDDSFSDWFRGFPRTPWRQIEEFEIILQSGICARHRGGQGGRHDRGEHDRGEP